MKKATILPHILRTAVPDEFHTDDQSEIALFGNFRLRPVARTDVPDIFRAIDTQREYLGRWLPFVAHTLHEEQTAEVVGEMIADRTLNPVFTIRENDVFAGLIGFKSTDSSARTTEIGYWLSEAWQGRGLMTQAVKALCCEAFRRRNIDRIEIRCALQNLPSNRIPLRLGFRLDRIEVRGEILSDGTCTDLNVYVLEKPQP